MNGSARGPLITLTTDFGLSDHYVGVMKCVILRICPEATIIDITHGIEPGNIIEAAYTLSQTIPYSPLGAIHVIVVDPGVGTQRSAIAVQSNHQTFIAPDNGVLTPALTNHTQTRELSNPALWLEPRSNTFHGRDLFAPSAAHLATGKVAWNQLGPELTLPIRLPNLRPSQSSPGSWQGIVLKIDHFGNVITNFPATLLQTPVSLECNGSSINRVFQTFGTAPDSDPFLYVGSSGNVEIGINRGNAATRLGAASGSPVSLTPGP